MSWRMFSVSAVAGAVIAVTVLASLPGYRNGRITPILAEGPDGTVVESFFFKSPDDGIALTHSGHLPVAIGPPGVIPLSEPAIDRGFALVLNVHDSHGEIIGFAVELEVHPEGDMLAEDLRWDTEWLLVIPGRGILILHQQEHSGELGPKVIDTIVNSAADWTGDWTVQTTVGPQPDGRGVVVGGTGEFDGAQGSFIEIDHLTRFTVDGMMVGDFELRVARVAEG